MSLAAADIAEINRIAARLLDQDGACTREPMFCVQRMRRQYGLDPELVLDEIAFIHDGEPVDSDHWWRLERAYENGEKVVEVDGEEYHLDKLTRTGYKDSWETNQVFLTREGAEMYLLANGHNIRPHRILVESFYRNAEMIALRRIIPLLAAVMPVASCQDSVGGGA